MSTCERRLDPCFDGIEMSGKMQRLARTRRYSADPKARRFMLDGVNDRSDRSSITPGKGHIIGWHAIGCQCFRELLG